MAPTFTLLLYAIGAVFLKPPRSALRTPERKYIRGYGYFPKAEGNGVNGSSWRRTLSPGGA